MNFRTQNGTVAGELGVSGSMGLTLEREVDRISVSFELNEQPKIDFS